MPDSSTYPVRHSFYRIENCQIDRIVRNLSVAILTEQPCFQEDCAEPGRNRKQEVLVRNRDGRQLGREKDEEDDDDLYFSSQLTRRHTCGGRGGDDATFYFNKY
jgi:hypothetical protein